MKQHSCSACQKVRGVVGDKIAASRRQCSSSSRRLSRKLGRWPFHAPVQSKRSMCSSTPPASISPASFRTAHRVKSSSTVVLDARADVPPLSRADHSPSPFPCSSGKLTKAVHRRRSYCLSALPDAGSADLLIGKQRFAAVHPVRS